MAYNPKRAQKFWRNTNKQKNRQLPHAGTKHSDIVRAQGTGVTLPGLHRKETASGQAVDVFSNESFEVRAEVLLAGNNLGFGYNPDADCIYRVARGLLYVTSQDSENGIKQISKIGSGGFFVANRGLRYSVATSTEDVEIVVISDKNYRDGWVNLEEGTFVAPEQGQVAAHGTEVIERRKDQSKAKAQAAQKGKKRGRKQSTKANAAGKLVSEVKPRVGFDTVGPNVRPLGPGAFSE